MCKPLDYHDRKERLKVLEELRKLLWDLHDASETKDFEIKEILPSFDADLLCNGMLELGSVLNEIEEIPYV